MQSCAEQRAMFERLKKPVSGGQRDQVPCNRPQNERNLVLASINYKKGRYCRNINIEHADVVIVIAYSEQCIITEIRGHTH